MRKEKIVIIRNAASQDFGGGERFPIFLAEILKEKQLNPVVISRSKKLLAFANERQINNITGWWWSKQQWNGLNNLLLPAYILWQFLLFAYYLILFIQLKPTTIHIQSKDDFIAATYAGRILRKNVVWTDHADLKHIWKNVMIHIKNPIGKMILIAAKYAHSITVVSQSEKNLVTNNLSQNSKILNKIRVVYNGVVDQSVEYIHSGEGDVFKFIVAGRLVKDKGVSEVIDAFKLLSKKYKNIQLILIGDGPDAKIFKSKASDEKSIKFYGHQTNPLNYISKANVFVHPTYHEGFSVALVEASMLSMPIIATSVGGNVEIIINNKTGLLVKSRNTGELFKAMEEMLTNKQLRNKLATNARNQYLEKFQFDNIVTEQFIPLYGVK